VAVADNPLARRMPGFDARHATRRARQMRVTITTILVVAAVAVGAVLLVRVLGHRSAPRRLSPPVTIPAPRTTATLSTWRLQAPISRAVVLPAANGSGLIIAGGTTTGGSAASGVFLLDLTSGTLTHVADLTTTLANAAGVELDGRTLVVGGTSPSTSPASSSVQSVAQTPPSPGQGAVPTATVVGALPEGRQGATAVVSGTDAYLVGGAGPTGADATVLATSDGEHFTTVASLTVPVLAPAVAVVGTKLYVFGGLGTTGAEFGRPIDAIQEVDLRTGRVTVAGRLPEPLSGAAAVVLGDDVLLAGGDTEADVTAPSTTAANPGGPTTTAVSTIWFFDPLSGRSTAVGQLAEAVSHAGVAVVGSRAWLVGGESDGAPQSVVQSFVATSPPPAGRRSDHRG
jgi:hypothetical protein